MPQASQPAGPIQTQLLLPGIAEKVRFADGHANGLLIGGNDLWIVAVSLAHGLPFLEHFKQVPGL